MWLTSGEKKFRLFLFFVADYQKLSLWDWLLAVWIYEEIFDNDSNDRSCDNTRDRDSSYDYDDFEEDF